ncbi:hypothetical protein EA658_10010 [Pseudoxanthomonas winnipegensis]|uniref:Secreted protein n=1 Tax=Pseudoxanthomonas winnipegensis TaxID=2480810 RepID=A0ABY1WCU5_9GAMM|nr:hypothetical protein [Pseudoxanthomonas winnipegensis]TAA12435.1 hypothetical protein EA659_03640 [Pseudoxanthomonas winnipegensis]TAA19200.1 hypothetical protein EA658_10010 [Pseudoxanthomonas winnipegensis]TAH70461.1 hypothetical protein EA657_17075 [Pseudoxanthomonas winnipegensis]
MRAWTENHTFAACVLLAALGVVLALADKSPGGFGQRLDAALAQTDQPNAQRGVNRGVSTGASHAHPVSAAGKPETETGVPQRTPPYEEGQPGLRQAGGSEGPAAQEETRPGHGYLAVQR